MTLTTRDSSGAATTEFIDPTLELNLGLWFLFAGATALLATRVWVKLTRAYLWYDDYILIASWVSLPMAGQFCTRTRHKQSND
jgi:hypothetical protein